MVVVSSFGSEYGKSVCEMFPLFRFFFSQLKSYEKREGKIVATFLVIDKTNSRLCAVLLEEEEERPELWECRPLLLLLLPSFIFEYKTQRKSKSKNRTQTGRNTRVGRLLHPLWRKKERKEVWRWHATFEWIECYSILLLKLLLFSIYCTCHERVIELLRHAGIAPQFSFYFPLAQSSITQKTYWDYNLQRNDQMNQKVVYNWPRRIQQLNCA